MRYFTNFVAQSTNEFTPRARLWVGNYYFNQGRSEDMLHAEEEFQRLSLSSSELGPYAQMMAGLAAQNRQKIPHFNAWLRGMIAYVNMVDPKV